MDPEDDASFREFMRLWDRHEPPTLDPQELAAVTAERMHGMMRSLRIAKLCSHCGKPMRGSAGLMWSGVPRSTPLRFNLCHPDTGMDCYRLVTVYRHHIVDCPCIYGDW